MQPDIQNEINESVFVKLENKTDEFDENISINEMNLSHSSNSFERKSHNYSKNSMSFSVQSILSSTVSNDLLNLKECENQKKPPDNRIKCFPNIRLDGPLKESTSTLHCPNITLTNIGYKVNFLQSQLTTNPSVLSPIIPRFIDQTNKPTMVMTHPFSNDGPSFLPGNMWRGHAVLPTNKFSMFSSIIPTSIPNFPHSFTTAGLQAILSNLQFRNRPRRSMLRRSVFSDGQRQGLEESFKKHAYITKPDRKDLADQLGLKDAQVKIWFQNRRMKWRNSKDRDHSTTEPIKKLDNYKEKKDSSILSNEKSLQSDDDKTDKISSKPIDCIKQENSIGLEPTDFSLKNDKLSLDYLIH